MSAYELQKTKQKTASNDQIYIDQEESYMVDF